MDDTWKGRENKKPTVSVSSLPSYISKTTGKSYTQKTRRWALLVAFLAILSLILVYTRSQYVGVDENMAEMMVSENETESIAKAKISPWRHGMVQVAHLDANLLPRERSMDQTTGNDRRLIFIGDIHGCKKELLALLEKASYRRETDHIVSVGDVLNKGPDSEGVLDFLMNEGASCVRGNHEDKVLRLIAEAKGFSEAKHPKKAGSKKEADTRALAKQISKQNLKFIRSFPLILNIGHIKGSDSGIVVVHGGLVPGLNLKNQDPSAVMNMRVIDTRDSTPYKDHDRKHAEPWFDLWGTQQMSLSSDPSSSDDVSIESTPTTVIYGHDAKRGLQVHKYTKGLDSACVRGGQLTALVISAGGTQEIFQVDCQQYDTD